MLHLRARVAAFAGVAAFVLVALTGCAPEENLSAQGPGSAPSEEVREATVEPEPEMESEPLSGRQATTQLPDTCPELLPAVVLQRADPRIEMFDTPREMVLERMHYEVGPFTMETLLRSDQQLFCSFGIRQTDGGGHIGIGLMSEGAKAELLVALRASVYEEVDAGEAEASFYQGSSEHHPHNEEIIVDGDVLIVVPHRVSGDFAWDALAAIQAGMNG